MARARDRFFAGFGKLGVRRPVLVALIVAIITAAGALLSTQLTITTSRFGLVADDNWYQRRMFEFFEAFGYADSPVAIIEGGTPEQRRETVDRLVAELEHDDLFRGKVIAKVDAAAVAETLLVGQPGTLAGFRSSLPADAQLGPALERGLEGVFGLLETQMVGALDGTTAAPASDPDAQLTQLAGLARALDRTLAADAGEGEPVDAHALLESLGGADAMPTPEELRARGLDEQGYFVSNDGERLLVAIFPEFASDEVAEYAPAVERLRAIRGELDLGDTQILFTGLPFLAVDEAAVLELGLRDASIATTGGIFLLLLWAFRSWRRSIISLIPIGVGTIVSLGALYLLFGTLDPITSSFAAVLMGLGIDFAVHLVARYDEDLNQGCTRRAAMTTALTQSGPGIVTGALTTALAFMTIATTEFTSYGQMGVITAIGLVVCVVATLLLLPLMFGRGDIDVGETPPKPMKLIGLIPRFARKAPLVVLLAGIGLAFAGAVALPPYNPRYLDLLPQGSEASEALQKLEHDGAMTPWFAWVTADDLDEARQHAASLRSQDSVGRVDSPTDMLPELTPERLAGLRADFDGIGPDPDWAKLRERKPDPAELAKPVGAVVDALDEIAFAAEQAGRDTTAIVDASKAFADLRSRLGSTPPASARKTLDRIEDDMAEVLGRAWTTARAVAERGEWLTSDLPDRFEQRFVASDGSDRLAIYVYPAHPIWDSDSKNEGARHFTEQLEAVDPEAAGQGITLWYHNEMIMNGFRRASIYSFLLVVVLLLLDFRSVRKTLLALFPVLIGMGWMIGMFNILDLRLNVATIVVIPLTLGIGIDAGVHMIHRWDQMSSRSGGGKARLDEMLQGTGGAVILSSLTTIVGFAGLLLGRHGGMTGLGAVMVVSVSCTLLASMLVLPALLLVLDDVE